MKAKQMLLLYTRINGISTLKINHNAMPKAPKVGMVVLQDAKAMFDAQGIMAGRE